MDEFRITPEDVGRRAKTNEGDVVKVLASGSKDSNYPYTFYGFGGVYYLVTEKGTRPDSYNLVAWEDGK